jgi:dihydrofolate reductase
MGMVFADISMSLDGFSAGSNDGPANPLGDHGTRIHQWFFGLDNEPGHAADSRVMDEVTSRTGAVILGRRMFENGLVPWSGVNPWAAPAFVLAHEPRDPLIVDGQIQFTFVYNGIESALDQARSVAGDRDVIIAGGANIVQQFIRSGLLDEVQIHIVPVLLGAGIRLFDQLDARQGELECVRVVESPSVTHLKYRIVR